MLVATVAAADGPQSSSFSDPGMPQQAISQQVSEVVVTSRTSPSAHVTADDNRHKARRQLSRDKRRGAKIKCPVCGGTYRKSNSSRHMNGQVHQAVVALLQCVANYRQVEDAVRPRR